MSRIQKRPACSAQGCVTIKKTAARVPLPVDDAIEGEDVGLFSSKGGGGDSSTNSDEKTHRTKASTIASTETSLAPASQTARSTSQRSVSATTEPTRVRARESEPQGENSMATMGQSIVFKGDLSGDEDLEIEGRVEGKVEFANLINQILESVNIRY